MKFKERLLHSVLFELGAIGLTAGLVVAFELGETHIAFAMSLLITMIAMLWNMLFNWCVDYCYSGKREKRSMKFRIGHTLAFELGLLLITVPIVAEFLHISWWQACLADMGLTCVIAVYGLIFNCLYDHLRLRFLLPNV